MVVGSIPTVGLHFCLIFSVFIVRYVFLNFFETYICILCFLKHIKNLNPNIMSTPGFGLNSEQPLPEKTMFITRMLNSPNQKIS